MAYIPMCPECFSAATDTGGNVTHVPGCDGPTTARATTVEIEQVIRTGVVREDVLAEENKQARKLLERWVVFLEGQSGPYALAYLQKDILAHLGDGK